MGTGAPFLCGPQLCPQAHQGEFLSASWDPCIRSIYINEQKRMEGPETAPHVGTALVRRTSVYDPLNLERDHPTVAYTSPTPRKAARSVSRRP